MHAILNNFSKCTWRCSVYFISEKTQAVSLCVFAACLNEVQEELLHYPRVSVSIGVGISKMLKFYVKVFKISYFLNPSIDLNSICNNNDRYGPKFYFTMPTPAHDL